MLTVQILILVSLVAFIAFARVEEIEDDLSTVSLRAATPEYCSPSNCKPCVQNRDAQGNFKDFIPCYAVCSMLGTAKTCKCRCYIPCTMDSDCPKSVLNDKPGQCGKMTHSCRILYDPNQCPDREYPCQAQYKQGKVVSESIFFYNKCKSNENCTSITTCAQNAANCKPICDTGINAGNGRYCVCGCPGEVD